MTDHGQSREHTGWLLIGLAAASLLGALIGLVAHPGAWIAITVMTLVQLGVTALGLTAPRRPVTWAIAVAVACLGSALLNPVLSELAYSGATPWIGLATAVATLNLDRSASDWSTLRPEARHWCWAAPDWSPRASEPVCPQLWRSWPPASTSCSVSWSR
ncbi:MAG: hypothetical protein ACTH1D_10815 [Mycobacteriaceae bacterium]